MKNKMLRMIGNAHIDPVWLWQWQEGFHEVKATFRSALDRMQEYDDFIFVSSSAVFYSWVEQSDPAMFEEIRRRVHEGRWRPRLPVGLEQPQVQWLRPPPVRKAPPRRHGG